VKVVVVGGGPAAQACAFALRARGHDGPVVVLAEEETPPYDRTLCSKDLLGATPPTRDQLLLEPEDAYGAAGIDLRLGERAEGLDWRARRVLLAGGRDEPYDRLVIATGGQAVRPAALDEPGVLTLRTLADSARLDAELVPRRRLAVIGGGFIGGEIASAARARGVEVTVIEALPAPLVAALGVAAGERVAALHRQAGVDLRTGVAVERVGRTGAGFEVRLVDGTTVEAGAVLVGVGMRPAIAWLGDAPIVENGAVATDAACRTALPGVLAAGDCASWEHARYGRVRVEHWDTARRHGAAAAAAALGAEDAFAPLPFFWSDQHGVKLQLVGRPDGADRVEVEDLDPPRTFVVRYLRGATLLAVLAAGLPRAVAAARKELLRPEVTA
jgi:3-phenylpropionate/trans-cinnamate dioxygenase ferredoxin reductase subunit